MILAGDIGGTKTNLALFEKEGEGVKMVFSKQFASGDFAHFSDVIDAFLQESHPQKIESAALGIAGPVIDGVCHTTNLPWVIETQALQKQLETTRVKLLNDLEATAYGMLFLDEDQFVSLNPDGEKVPGNRAVIAAGTGLGEAMLYWDGQQFHPIATEGGHSDFATNTPQQDQLLKWLRSRYPTHVSVERVLSGPGLYVIYQFLAESGFAPEPEFMCERAKESDASALVSQGALEYKDPLCSEALRLFCEIYGAESGNMALKSLSVGGVYIGGGIAPKILPFLEKHFMKSFLHKGRFESLLKKMEVKVAMDPETALTGAAMYAAYRL